MITAETLRRFAPHILHPDEHAAALEAQTETLPSERANDGVGSSAEA